MKKSTVSLLVLFAVLLGIFVVQKVLAPKTNTPQVSNIPNQIKKTSPITYKNATSDAIVIDSPLPGSITAKTFAVTGKARGPWYFEASFPITILDNKGKVISTSIATAKGDWMTTDFFPFETSIKIPESYTGKATLILTKDNPSGLAEKDASVSFIITIK